MARRTFVASMVLVLCASTAEADGLVVIVHPENQARIELSDIVQIYLKQRRYWRDGETIVPVNQDAGSPARESFARQVFAADSRSLVAYWNREYFRGVLPPPTLASNEAILRFVATEPRAVGYVPAELADERVRVVYRLEAKDPKD